MLSIFIMYSCDRKDQLNLTVSFLRKMELYENCQKILVADDSCNVHFPEFETIIVPRVEDEFVWADMWNAGVFSARYENIWYLDSDRLLPHNYIRLILDNIADDKFLFTSRHFMVTGSLCEKDFHDLVESEFDSGVFVQPRYQGKIAFEPRFGQLVHGPGKNVMSGNTAFTRTTYKKLGGVDRWYRGHGAYADTDFHMTASQCQFQDLETIELHCHHLKLGEKGAKLTKEQFEAMSYRNYVHYLEKWDLPVSLADRFKPSAAS